jgi:hypothetical protein
VTERDTYTIVMGSLLTVFGALLLLDRTGVMAWTASWSIWWMLLVTFGVAQLATSNGRRGLFTTILGLWLLAVESRWIAAAQTWPLLLVGLGAGIAWQGLRPEPPLDAAGPDPSGTPDEMSDRAMRRRYRRRQRSFSPVIAILAILAITNVLGHDRRARADTNEAGQLRVFSVLGGSRRTPDREFKGGEITTVLGGNDVDLRRAQVAAGEEVTIDVFTVMGGTTIRVPDTWNVDLQARAVLGEVRDGRPRRSTFDANGDAVAAPPAAGAAGAATGSTAGAPRLIVRGMTVMGGIVIR